MRLALMFLDRVEGQAHFALSHARVLAEEVDLTCYLSARNTLLPRFMDLPCKVKTFDWARGQYQLMRAVLLKRDPTGVSDEIKVDAPDMLLDSFSTFWSAVVEKAFRRSDSNRGNHP